MIDRTCQSCQTRFSAPEGQPAVCPRCGQQVVFASPPTGDTMPPPAPPIILAHAAIVQGPGKGLAIAAMVLGLCGLFCGLPGILGLILGIVCLATHRPGRGMAITGIVMGAVSLLIPVAIILPALGRARQLAKQSICASNLHGIYSAVAMYEVDYSGNHPPDLQRLVPLGVATPDMFVCASRGVPLQPGQVRFDYFYFPGYDANTAPATAIMACDYGQNHAGKGRNVLYADGHVAFTSERVFASELARPENAQFAAALRAAEALPRRGRGM